MLSFLQGNAEHSRQLFENLTGLSGRAFTSTFLLAKETPKNQKKPQTTNPHTEKSNQKTLRLQIRKAEHHSLFLKLNVSTSAMQCSEICHATSSVQQDICYSHFPMYDYSVEQYRNWIIPPEEKKAKSDQIKQDLKSPVCIVLERREQEDKFLSTAV